MRRLHVSPELSLPLDAVTQRISILGRTGSGKSYAAGVLVEEVLGAKQQVVIVDLKGDWYGLRSAANGKDPGFPITILGGQHGDVPLEPTAGKLIADLVVDTGASFILDLSDFESRADEIRFVTDFTDRLYRRKARKKSPMLLVLEEADQLAPQKPQDKEAIMVARVGTVARRGRGRGIGVLLCSQRSADVSKSILSQTELLVAHQTTDPRDKKAIFDWVEDKVENEEQKKEFRHQLTRLKKQGVWWSPSWLDIYRTVKVRAKRTFDSGKTPKVGQARREPRKLAMIDLEKLKTHMAATIERAKAADPRAAQAEIAKLKSELAVLKRELEKKPIKVTAQPVVTKTEYKVVEVNVVRKSALTRAEKVVEQMSKVLGRFNNWEVALSAEISRLSSAIAQADAGEGVSVSTARLIEQGKEVQRQQILAPIQRKPSSEIVLEKAKKPDVTFANAEIPLVAGERKILSVAVSAWPMKRTRGEIATLSGYSIRSGTFKQYWRSLLRRGYFQDAADGILVTPKGLDLFEKKRPEPQGHDEIVAMWRGKLVRGEVAILDYAISRYPNWINMEEMSQGVSLSLSSGSTKQYLRSLRRNGVLLISDQGIRAADLLFPEGKTA